MLQAHIAWAMVHGVAKLAIARRLPLSSKKEILRFTAQAIEALQEGLRTWRGAIAWIRSA